MHMGTAAAALAAGFLIMIAALHIAWALGWKWPGHDEESLARLVVGGPSGMRFPSAAACGIVAVLLCVAATLVLGQQRILALPLPRWLVQLGTAGVAAVLGLRGIGGFFDQRLRPQIKGSPFVRLNLWLYSPLCLILAALALVALCCGPMEGPA